MENLRLDENETQELVFPFYLDTEMLTAFLASLEGGFYLSENVSQTQRSSADKEGSVEGSAGVSNFLAGLFRMEMRGGLKIADFAEDNRELQFVVQHTEASLLNRLREQLLSRGMITHIDGDTDQIPLLGSIVEIDGVIEPNPLGEFLKLMKQGLDWMGVPVEPPQTQPAKARSRNARRGAKPAMQSEPFGDDDMAQRVFQMLLAEESEHKLTDVLVQIDSETLQSGIVTLRQSATSTESSEHFIGSRCLVLGKVSGVVEEGESVPLYRRSILNVLGQEAADQMFTALYNAPGLNFGRVSTSVKGPAVQILPLAIYV